MWTTSTRTLRNPLPQRSSVSLIDLFLFWVISKFTPCLATQIPPSSPPPLLPTRQTIDETTPLFSPHSSHPSAQPRRHTIIGPHAHDLVLGHHRHEPPQQHERHHIDHPRCGLTQFFSPEETAAEDSATAKVPPERDHHVAEYQQPRRYLSHSHGHSHHDMESLFETPDLEAETDSEDDEAEIKIGRKRQIIGILVRFSAFRFLHRVIDDTCFFCNYRFYNWVS
jgi:hypothetical protein